jgi:hypothetical protein
MGGSEIEGWVSTSDAMIEIEEYTSCRLLVGSHDIQFQKMVVLRVRVHQ